MDLGALLNMRTVNLELRKHSRKVEVEGVARHVLLCLGGLVQRKQLMAWHRMRRGPKAFKFQPKARESRSEASLSHFRHL